MSPLALAPEAITAAFRNALGDKVVDTSTAAGQATVVVRPDAWREAAAFARTSDLDCDFFCFLSAIDWTEVVEEELAPPDEDDAEAAGEAAATEAGEAPPPAETAPEETAAPAERGESDYRETPGEVLQMLCRLYSTRHVHAVHLKANLGKDDPRVDTLTGVYGGADWHEREATDMFGIEVVGHPNPARIYLPDDFEGHPLRKTFKLGARIVKPWPGMVNTEPMPEDTPVTEPKPGQP